MQLLWNIHMYITISFILESILHSIITKNSITHLPIIYEVWPHMYEKCAHFLIVVVISEVWVTSHRGSWKIEDLRTVWDSWKKERFHFLVEPEKYKTECLQLDAPLRQLYLAPKRTDSLFKAMKIHLRQPTAAVYYHCLLNSLCLWKTAKIQRRDGGSKRGVGSLVVQDLVVLGYNVRI